MKAFLLAAGKGTRLRPFTNKHPKCLVQVNSKPLLEIWFEALVQSGITQVMINKHHHSDQVEDYIKQNKFSGLEIFQFYEHELLGSAGTVAANSDFIGRDEDFLVIYADNLTDLDLKDFMKII